MLFTMFGTFFCLSTSRALAQSNAICSEPAARTTAIPLFKMFLFETDGVLSENSASVVESATNTFLHAELTDAYAPTYTFEAVNTSVVSEDRRVLEERKSEHHDRKLLGTGDGKETKDDESSQDLIKVVLGTELKMNINVTVDCDSNVPGDLDEQVWLIMHDLKYFITNLTSFGDPALASVIFAQALETQAPTVSPVPSTMPSAVPSFMPSDSPSVSQVPSQSPSSTPSSYVPSGPAAPSGISSSAPSFGPRQFSTIQIVSIEGVSAGPIDNETIEVFETTTQKFIMENLPPDDNYAIEITSVDVVDTKYGFLQKQTVLKVALNIIGNVVPGNPPDSFLFSDAVGHGFATNFTGFLTLLSESSSFFRAPNGASRIDVAAAAIVVAAAAGFILWRNTRRWRSSDNPADNGRAGDGVSDSDIVCGAVRASSLKPETDHVDIETDIGDVTSDIGNPSSSSVDAETELGPANHGSVSDSVNVSDSVSGAVRACLVEPGPKHEGIEMDVSGVTCDIGGPSSSSVETETEGSVSDSVSEVLVTSFELVLRN